MAGATGSGQDIETGRVNRAEGRTILWAQVPPGQANFNGPAILIAEVAHDAENPDDYTDGESFVPSDAFDGVVATGWSGGSASQFGGTPGAGFGVIGKGGRNQGTGVIGFGSGTKEPGSGNGGGGGTGVHGVGGSQPKFFGDPNMQPGVGVIGQGGRQDPSDNTAQKPHAPGMVAIGGGEGQPLPLLMDTGGLGVWAQGADAEILMVPPSDASGTIPGPDVPSGPLVPGAGVFGRGGVPNPPHGPPAAGVIGLMGGTNPIPAIDETGGCGVYGAGQLGVFGHGPTGVRGKGEVGAGVHGNGFGPDSRGGMFESTRAAQVQLVPHPTFKPGPPTASLTPQGVIAGGEGQVMLPKNGAAGDLLVQMDKDQVCTLWFCVQGASMAPARWAQVLLGQPFNGIA